MSIPAGWFKFGAAHSSDQLTVRLSAMLAVSEVKSVGDDHATLYLYLVRGEHPMAIGYGARSAAEMDRASLMKALAAIPAEAEAREERTDG